jgi:hypothetical protein
MFQLMVRIGGVLLQLLVDYTDFCNAIWEIRAVRHEYPITHLADLWKVCSGAVQCWLH